MRGAGRDPAEAGAEIFALAATLVVALLLAVEKIAPPPSSGAHANNQVELSVVAPPRDEPKPQPIAAKRAPIPVHRVRVTRPVRRRQTAAAPARQPISTPETPAAAESAAPAIPAAPPAASAPAGPVDPNLAYRLALNANVRSRTCPPDTAEYRLLRPTGRAIVGFTVDRAGAVSDVRIQASSGSTILDKQAYAIVSSGRYPSMPSNVYAGDASHMFQVEVEFRGGGCAL
ncbi:MAG TPA: TonB family protein [Rhizomicrobium sp.]|jgi:TonB family protein|nr:TonB family protein [Rhizomicrobium sp.]